MAYVPALDLSSCGSTDEEARKNIRDSVRGFLETSAAMGSTLDEILREGGFERSRLVWEQLVGDRKPPSRLPSFSLKNLRF